METRKAIAELGKSHYIGLSTGFWYEWSLAIPSAFGFDLVNRKATLFDDGEAKISTSTWAQVYTNPPPFDRIGLTLSRLAEPSLPC